ncbi:hypothetical protein BRADI_4g11694v3 [Brachypodium distachyon]|uniref:F-box domain-containing protein n=1 Tax=Brachypodium distachyon TaxID=15368 RepID=A0A2K2CM69_BRADI|nr:hypothetical protein BRADI_4g11694v3 [Brachypodium distachyon]
MAAEAAAGVPQLPEELIIWEILTRLPAKPVGRCRAVCRSWRRGLTSDPKFLLAHHRRQPSLPLLTTEDDHERRIDAMDHRTGEQLPVLRTDRVSAAAKNLDLDLDVLASCDGLLLVIAYGGLHICNPATRERAPVPLPQQVSCVAGLYAHRPSGSYRVLRQEGRGRPRRVPRAHRRVRRERAPVRRGASGAVGVRGHGAGDAHDGVPAAARPGGRQDLLAPGDAARRRQHRQGQQHAGVRHGGRVVPAPAVARRRPIP